MWYSKDGSVEKKNYRKHFLVVSILFSLIMIQVSVTAYPSTVLAVPRVTCINPAPPNNGVSAPTAPATPGLILINEVLFSSVSQWNCTAPNNTPSQANDWIEIYNPQNQPFDLYAAHATIDEGQSTQEYPLPFGSIITAHGFFVVFPFMNLAPTNSARLVIAQVVIDQISTPILTADTSYARIPDGSNNWQITTSPTIASSNTLNSTIATKQATPTRKPKPIKATSTPKHTTTRKSTNTHATNTTNNETHTTNDGTNIDSSTTSNTGIQPTWSALRLPSSSTTRTNNVSQHTVSPPSLSSTTAADSSVFNNKIFLMLLAIALFLALLGGWYLYKRHKSIRT